MTSGLRRFLVLVLPVYLLIVAVRLGAFPNGPVPGVTGGFGEPTCNKSGCHNSFPLNAGKGLKLGDVVISGLPAKYDPGKTYPIKLAVTHTENRGHWGFQLAARVKATGAQAGELKPASGATQIVEEKGIQYIEHTLEGNSTNTFDFAWIAPSGSVGEIAIDAAGNAADGDDTPEGDYIYSTSVSISPAVP